MRLFLLLFSVLTFSSFVSCDSKEERLPEDPVFELSTDSISFNVDGGQATVSISMNGSLWTASSDQDWCSISIGTSSKASDQMTVSTSANTSSSERVSRVSFKMDDEPAGSITILQKGKEPEEDIDNDIYPEYGNRIEPDATGMNSTAVELAAKFHLGWNIGNTLEAIGGENAWGNPNISKEFVEAVKSQGFNAIRLPCSWDQHSNQTTAKIKQQWLDRVKEVVQYCVDNDMYVLLNIHWDGGWLENNCTPEKQEAVNAKQRAFWQQIATHMRDFDERLMFASANEPHVENATQMEVLHSYHQTFVNTVRATGGRNSYRVLVVQGPSTDIEKTNDLMADLPADEVEDRMMAEIHYYTPYQFCLMSEDASWGKMFYYWGDGYHSAIETERNATWGEESDVDKFFGMMKSKFVDNGIPVILGEYGAYRRGNSPNVPEDLDTHNDAVDHWIRYTTKKAVANGLKPFFWDTGGALDRANHTVKDQRTIDALIEGGE